MFLAQTEETSMGIPPSLDPVQLQESQRHEKSMKTKISEVVRERNKHHNKTQVGQLEEEEEKLQTR